VVLGGLWAFFLGPTVAYKLLAPQGWAVLSVMRDKAGRGKL